MIGTSRQPVIAERSLDCVGDTRRVVIRVHAPEPSMGDLPWRCGFIVTGIAEITATDEGQVLFAEGRDSFEALAMALLTTRNLLDRASERLGLEFAWPEEGWHAVPQWVPVHWGRRAERRLFDALVREETLMVQDREGLEPLPPRALSPEQRAAGLPRSKRKRRRDPGDDGSGGAHY